MNLCDLRDSIPCFDETKVIGHEVEKDGTLYHIVGMSRAKDMMELYVLGIEEEKQERNQLHSRKQQSNRSKIMNVPDEKRNYFMNIKELIIGDLRLEVWSADSRRFDYGDLIEESFLLAEFMKIGWKLEENNPFLNQEGRNLSLTKVRFRTKIKKLPEWKNQERYIRTGNYSEKHLLEKKVTLTVGKEKKLTFSMPNGKECTCYINKVYPMDVWKKQEELLNNPENLEFMTAKELKKRKQLLFRMLARECPKGTCYLCVEYECTEEVTLEIYSREYLSAKPKAYSGSAVAIGMMLKPDEPIGKHGLKQKGVVIQTPIASNIEEMKAEIIGLQIITLAKEERL